MKNSILSYALKTRLKKIDFFKNNPHIAQEITFNYLIKMPMDSVSQENIDKLMKEHGDKELELKKINNSKIQDLWLHELENLKKLYNEFILEDKEEFTQFKKPKKH